MWRAASLGGYISSASVSLSVQALGLLFPEMLSSERLGPLLPAFYLPAVAKGCLRQSELPRAEPQVILWVAVEVATKPTGVALVRTRHADLQVGATVPEHLARGQEGRIRLEREGSSTVWSSRDPKGPKQGSYPQALNFRAIGCAQVGNGST